MIQNVILSSPDLLLDMPVVIDHLAAKVIDLVKFLHPGHLVKIVLHRLRIRVDEFGILPLLLLFDLGLF